MKAVGGGVRAMPLPEFRFGSSQTFAATFDANLGIKGALANIGFACGFELKFL
jgi:hypothetical protein